MPSTFMLLEKMRGAAPKLLDSSTYEVSQKQPKDDSEHNNQDLVFSGQKPADSGVGASVASCSNLPKSAQQAKIYLAKTYSDNFHDFVDQCCYRDADGRLTAAQLLTHPFIKQLKKSSSSALSMASLLDPKDFISIASKPNSEDAMDESLIMAMDSKMAIDDEIEWDFQ